MKINIITQILGSSGYSSHGRQLANALNKLCDVKITTQLLQGWELQVTDEELKMIQKPDSFDRTNIIIDLPFNWSQHLTKEFNVGFLVWEGDKIPLSWVDCIKDRRISEVWVPSLHVLTAVKNTLKTHLEAHTMQIIMNKVKLVPHGVNLDIFKNLNRPTEIFTFLINKGFRNELDRGGMQHAIRAFLEEFKKGEARLIIKINPAYAMSHEQLNNLISKYISEIGKRQAEIPEIAASYENIPYSSLNELYNSADILLNPTHAEAFGLPALESMACGKPTISTNYGGHLDFVNESNSWLINYTMKEVKHELLYEGINQAEPDLSHLKQLMREAYTNKELLLKKGKKAEADAIHCSWNNSAQKAMEYLSQHDAERLS